MHELGIAESILDLVGRHAPADRGRDVRVVHVVVGDLSGVLPDSLAFCFDALAPTSAFPRAVRPAFTPSSANPSGAPSSSTREPSLMPSFFTSGVPL